MSAELDPQAAAQTWMKADLANPVDLLRGPLGNGVFEGRRIVALGGYIYQTPNGNIVWHDGGSIGFGSFVGMAPDRNIGVIILANETNIGLPVAVGLWLLDLILGNPERHYVADKLIVRIVREGIFWN